MKNNKTHNSPYKVTSYRPSKYLSSFDRNLLSSITHYYFKQFPNLKMTSKWVTVDCCFHENKKPSLSLNLQTGRFHCFGCGTEGGDIIAFHCQRFAMSFGETLTFFGAWSYVH